MYVNRKAPYGTVYALEGLEVVLITAAFDQDVSMVFVDDGVFQIKKDQETSGVNIKSVFCFTALETSISVFFKFCKILLFDFNWMQETRNITSL